MNNHSAVTKKIRAALLLAIFCSMAISNLFAQSKFAAEPLKDSRQLLLVTTADWHQVSGVLRCFERKNVKASWREVGSKIEIVVGRNGIAWGRGLHPATTSEPQKKEGDGKSPAGIFKLSSAFGFAPASEMKRLKLPYLQLTDAIECVDDVPSKRYNSIVDRNQISGVDWKSSEKMLAIGEQYRLGIVVDHNVSPRISGQGSCIFVHIWKGDGSGTSGCTATEKPAMEKLLSWLDAKAKPVLVQLPEAEFRRLQTDWQLPKIKLNSATPR